MALVWLLPSPTNCTARCARSSCRPRTSSLRESCSSRRTRPPPRKAKRWWRARSKSSDRSCWAGARFPCAPSRARALARRRSRVSPTWSRSSSGLRPASPRSSASPSSRMSGKAASSRRHTSKPRAGLEDDWRRRVGSRGYRRRRAHPRRQHVGSLRGTRPEYKYDAPAESALKEPEEVLATRVLLNPLNPCHLFLTKQSHTKHTNTKIRLRIMSYVF